MQLKDQQKNLLVKNILIPNLHPNSQGQDQFKKTRSLSPLNKNNLFQLKLVAKCVRLNQANQVQLQSEEPVKKVFLKAEKGFQILPKIPINLSPKLHHQSSIKLFKDHLQVDNSDFSELLRAQNNLSKEDSVILKTSTASFRKSKSPSPLKQRFQQIHNKQESVGNQLKQKQQDAYQEDSEFIEQLIKNEQKSNTQNELIIQRRKQIHLYQKIKSTEYNITENEIFQLFTNIHFKIRPQLKEEYFYFNKGETPYDLLLTSFEKKNPVQYYTVSHHGVIIYNKGDQQFLSIERFQKEKKSYYDLKKIPFFKQFSEFKIFQRWKKLMRKQVMQKCRQTIESKLFILNPMFRKSILKIRGICLEVSQIAIFSTNYVQSISSIDIKRYHKFQMTYLQTTFIERLTQLTSKISEIISNSCKNSLQIFTQVHHISTLQEASFTQQAVLTFQYKQLTHFIRFVDFLHTDSKSWLMCQGLGSIVKMIDNMIHGREVGGKVKINGFLEKEDSGCEKLYPSRELQNQIFESIVYKSCEITANLHEYFYMRPELKQYMIIDFFENQSEDPAEMKAELQQNLKNSVEFKQNFSELQQILDLNYKQIENMCQVIQTLRELYKSYQPIQNDQLGRYEAQEFSELFNVFLQDKKDLYEMDNHMDIGFYSLDHTELIEQVKNQMNIFYKNSFAAIEEKIDQMACFFFEKLKQNNKQLYNYPENLDQFYQFLISYQVIEKQREVDRSFMKRIQDLSQVCVNKKIMLSGQLKQLITQTIYSYGELEKKIIEIQANMDSLQFKYKQQLEREIEIFKMKTNTFINKNLTYLQIHRDLQDVNFIMQRLKEELHNDYDQLDQIKKSILVTYQHLDIDPKYHADFSFYHTHQMFLSKTERFWEIVKYWIEIQNNLLNQHYTKIQTDSLMLEIEEVLASRQNNIVKILEIQDYLDLDVQNSEVVLQLFQFLQNMSNILNFCNELKNLTSIEDKKSQINNQINIILNNQQQKLFPDLVIINQLNELAKLLTKNFISFIKLLFIQKGTIPHTRAKLINYIFFYKEILTLYYDRRVLTNSLNDRSVGSNQQLLFIYKFKSFLKTNTINGSIRNISKTTLVA
ncbi:hypothetical protein ABPG72_021951 [Tetrahymena utriculariae]